jgi:hypothetical protein
VWGVSAQFRPQIGMIPRSEQRFGTPPARSRAAELWPLRRRAARRQFRDGEINAYEELPNGRFEHRGELRGSDGKPLTIDGLWALRFGNGGNAGPTGTLFFTAGPDDESHGLFGSITAD